MAMGLLIFKRVLRHSLPAISIIGGKGFVVKNRAAIDERNNEEHQDGNGVWEKRLVPGLLHMNNITEKQQQAGRRRGTAENFLQKV